MVDVGLFGTLMKVLESLLRKMHIHTFLQTFSGDRQASGINMDFSLVLKASTLDTIWRYVALLVHCTQRAWTATIDGPAGILPFLPSPC